MIGEDKITNWLLDIEFIPLYADIYCGQSGRLKCNDLVIENDVTLVSLKLITVAVRHHETWILQSIL